ncbi:MAG: hypothetical protein IM638_18170 [Bacteroidetes bacterium]|nr:hypothetical protein [Bacteroidota bacterium]
MKLAYNILWFEDNDVSYSGKKEIVKNIIEDELGFLFPEPLREIDSRNIEQINYRDIDLIIVDLNLANNDKGTSIVDFIRNTEQVFTEVVFYSSYGEDAVRDALRSFKIDGAYCADRENADFEDKVRQVIHTTVKKVQDLNNMRGLIMAETSDIDKTMLEIIKIGIDNSSLGIRENLINQIFDSVSSKVSRKKEKFDRYYYNKNINQVIKDTVMFDTSEKINAIQFIIDTVSHNVTQPYKYGVFTSRYSEITKKRNILGHENQTSSEGRVIVGVGDHAFEFNDEFCIDIRRRVKKYGDDLDDLLRFVSSL